MDTRKALDGLDLDDDCALDKKIETVSVVQSPASKRLR
jgi:hypothetical protein